MGIIFTSSPSCTKLTSTSSLLGCREFNQQISRRGVTNSLLVATMGWWGIPSGEEDSPLSSSSSSKCWAMTPTEASQAYDTYAPQYDALDGGSAADRLGISQAREQLVSKAKGRVLEIGVGTGLNLDNYPPLLSSQTVTSLTLLDISSGMLEQAKNRWETSTVKSIVPSKDDNEDGESRGSHPIVEFVQGDATSELVQRFGIHSFDTIIDSFSLCVMGTMGAQQCLKELQQIIIPDTGRILLLENSRAINPILGSYQDLTASTAAWMGGKGCVYNQNVRAMIEATSGLEILNEDIYAGGLFRAYECRTRST